jgi:putative oxidoreductase
VKKLFSTKYSDRSLSFALLLLRIGLGGLMIRHGYSKMVNFTAEAVGFPDPFGIGSTTSLALTVFAEFFCAIFNLVGLMTRLASIPLIIAMSVIVFYSHNGAVFAKAELPALYLMGYLALLFTGPGKISMDKLIGK